MLRHHTLIARAFAGLVLGSAVLLPARLAAQAHRISWTLGAGFVAQSQTGPVHEQAIGYTATFGATRPLSRSFRLHADARYSFNLSLGGTPTTSCLSRCITDGLSATRVLSTTVGLEWLTSRWRPGLLFRAGAGLHYLPYQNPGARAGLLPALATAVAFRVPFGHRGAFYVEGRYDRLFGTAAGPSELLPMLFGFEF